jgi:hypothetical protein
VLRQAKDENQTLELAQAIAELEPLVEKVGFLAQWSDCN